MKKLQDMIKDLTAVTVEEQKINYYLDLEYEPLDLEGAKLRWVDLQGVDLSFAKLKGVKITKQQLDKLTVIEDDK
ncbi:hypothetical protein C6B38_06875 [Spiroplasma sp. ChiS]|uniref:pentapeptide repeat-containing protein n=1 Tax=Spiroplasma sp. ChiS TaxID=2099885 RepID=UPI000CF8F10E|nr:pentapeptide repeat-containing protein [Spiroplasma sp. ChiS]PQP78308.1 hypothetical protein C6B38_06875 [Spiroplasma sp. ChiS]